MYLHAYKTILKYENIVMNTFSNCSKYHQVSNCIFFNFSINLPTVLFLSYDLDITIQMLTL